MAHNSKKDNQHSGDHEAGRKQRPIHTDTRVHGGIEIHPSPILVKRDEAERKDDKAANQKNYQVSRATAYATMLYCALTLGLVFLAGWNIKIARDTFKISNRAYVGIELITITHYAKGSETEMRGGEKRTNDTVTLVFGLRIKNYGLAPARNAVIVWNVLADKDPVGSKRYPDKPRTIFPSEEINIRDRIDDPAYTEVMSGKKTLKFDLRISYDGPTGERYEDCVAQVYDPEDNLFFNLGACQ